jgi:hypothetical protein
MRFARVGAATETSSLALKRRRNALRQLGDTSKPRYLERGFRTRRRRSRRQTDRTQRRVIEPRIRHTRLNTTARVPDVYNGFTLTRRPRQAPGIRQHMGPSARRVRPAISALSSLPAGSGRSRNMRSSADLGSHVPINSRMAVHATRAIGEYTHSLTDPRDGRIMMSRDVTARGSLTHRVMTAAPIPLRPQAADHDQAAEVQPPAGLSRLNRRPVGQKSTMHGGERRGRAIVARAAAALLRRRHPRKNGDALLGLRYPALAELHLDGSTVSPRAFAHLMATDVTPALERPASTAAPPTSSGSQ